MFSSEFPIAAVPDQCAGELQQAEIVRSVLVVANQNGPALAQPGKRSLDDPTAWLATTRPSRTCFFADRADVSNVALRCGSFAARGVVEPFVEQKMFFLVVGAFDDDRKQRIFQAPSVVPVGWRSRYA